MHTGNHTRIQPPGHETVLVCRKCGWTFPNTHPSARHRRAHKKICGTIEGYKLVVSNGSDDDLHSDEDCKIPNVIQPSSSSSKDQFVSTTPYQDNEPTVVSMVNYVEESHTVLTDVSNSVSPDSCLVKPENKDDNAAHKIEANFEEAVIEIGQISDSRGNPEARFDLDGISQDVMIKHIANEVTDIAPKLEKMNEEDVVLADGALFQSKEESIEDLNPKIFASVVHEEMRSFDNSQTNVGVAQPKNSINSTYIVEGSLAHPEFMLEDFKNHKGVKLDRLVPFDDDSCERTAYNEASFKKLVGEDNSSDSQPKQMAEAPSEGEIGLPEVTVTIDKSNQSDEAGVHPCVEIVEMQNGLIPVEENVSITTKPVPEISSNLHESQVAADDATNGFNDNVPNIGYTHLVTHSESSRDGTELSNIQEGTNKKINDSGTVKMDCVDGISIPIKSSNGEKVSERHMIKEQQVSPQISAPAVEENYTAEIGGLTSTIGTPETLQEETNNNAAKQIFAAADISMDSCSQTDSLDANWGSVSVLSTQSDLQNLKIESEAQSADGHDPPSFLTLVQNRATTVIDSKTKADQNMQAGWFPSLTNVANESVGRKKNEEMIAKVKSWSSEGTRQRHTPLKALLSEAKENSAPMVRKDDAAGKENGCKATTVNSILGMESPAGKASTEKIAREMKEGKRKIKGWPMWAQFVCCSSV